MREISLAQSLAIESQIRLPGSAGRLLKQIRDIESVAPIFRDAGLVKAVERPATIDLTVSGVTTRSCVKGALGGFVYASAAVRTDMLIEANRISTRGSDSVAELDDIDFEAQRKRLDLVEMRQAYALAERLLKSSVGSQLIVLDTPLFITRDMAPLSRNVKHQQEYDKTREAISRFWEVYRQELFPWNSEGPVLVSILSQRFSAIVSIARQDLRTERGRECLLLSDGFNQEKASLLTDLEERLSGVGDHRFIKGILGSFTRTMAFRMTQRRERMEPSESVEAGVVGFHFRGGRSSAIQMAQLAGEESDWNADSLDAVAWKLMVLDMQGKSKSTLLPQLLGQQQLGMIEKFTEYYRQGLSKAMKENEVEETWLSGLFEGEL